MKKTYLGASSGLDGNELNVVRMVVSLNKSGYDCQASTTLLPLDVWCNLADAGMGSNENGKAKWKSHLDEI